MHMKTWIVAAALGTTAIAGAAFAIQAPRPMHAMKADTNGDGAVSKAEFLAKAETRFAAIDTNKDGKLTAEERRAGRGIRGGWRGRRHMMQDGPTGPRGGMGRGGFGNGQMMLDRLDTDKDSRISLAEFQAMAARWPAPDGGDPAARTQRQAERFKRLDANADGYVDKAEMAATAQRMRGMRGDTPPPPPPAPAVPPRSPIPPAK